MEFWTSFRCKKRVLCDSKNCCCCGMCVFSIEGPVYEAHQIAKSWSVDFFRSVRNGLKPKIYKWYKMKFNLIASAFVAGWFMQFLQFLWRQSVPRPVFLRQPRSPINSWTNHSTCCYFKSQFENYDLDSPGIEKLYRKIFGRISSPRQIGTGANVVWQSV